MLKCFAAALAITLVGSAGGPALGQVSSASAPAGGQPAAVQPLIYPDAEQFSIPSRHTGRTYVISVVKPRLPIPVFSIFRLPTPQRFPVVYMLDADYGFQLSAQLGQLMQGGEDVTPFYSVGIGYGTTDFARFMELRQGDLTPTVDPKAHPVIAAWGMGGAEKFLQFIETELKPEIARRYPAIDPANSTISGLSHGGLFALWTLFTHPQAFRNYIALDPANWHDYVGERIEAGFARTPRPLTDRRLYVGLASPAYSDPALRAASDGIRERGLRFCGTIEGRRYAGLAMKCEAHAGQSHFSVVAPGTTQGFRWALGINAPMAPMPPQPVPTPKAR